jgi:hypothetical protein
MLTNKQLAVIRARKFRAKRKADVAKFLRGK